MQKIQKNIILVVVALVILLGGGYYFVNKNDKQETKTTTASTQDKAITLSVKADGSEKKYTVENAVGKTALAATEETVTVGKTGEGKDAFINSINGRVASDSKKEFWKLVINGKDAQVGAGSYTLVKGDIISWEIATY